MRHRVRVLAASLLAGMLGLAAVDPIVAPNAFFTLWALKLALLAQCVWLWWQAAQATAATRLEWRVVGLFVFGMAISVPSTLLVGIGWHSIAIMSALALAAAAVMPWTMRMQAILIACMSPFALIPLFIAHAGSSAVFVIATTAMPIGLSLVFARQQELYQHEVRQRLEAFRENLERLRQLTEHIHGVFWLSEPDGRLLYVSPRYEESWRQSRAALRRDPDAWLEAVHPEDRAAVSQWARGSAEIESYVREYRLVARDGRVRWIRDARFPIAGAGGQLRRIARFSLDITAERDAASARRMQELARSIQTALEAERKRMARELHDGLGQALTGIQLLLSGLEQPLAAIRPEAGVSIRNCIAEVRAAMQSVHAMVHMLRPPALDDLGLIAALRSQADAFAKHTGIPCTLELPDEEPSLSEEQVTTVFRIAQESLTNVARHAHAHRVVLRLGVHDDRLRLCVEDDGKGIAAAHEDFGVLGMRERASLLNGSLDIETRREGGTLVRLELPRQMTPVGAALDGPRPLIEG